MSSLTFVDVIKSSLFRWHGFPIIGKRSCQYLPVRIQEHLCVMEMITKLSIRLAFVIFGIEIRMRLGTACPTSVYMIPFFEIPELSRDCGYNL